MTIEPISETFASGTARMTSRGRLWTGFDAALYDVPGGPCEFYAAHDSICMHVGGTVPGEIEIVPARSAAVWLADRAATKLVVSISRLLMQNSAEKMEILLDGISIPRRHRVRDPLLEHIGWALKAELESAAPAGRVYADGLGVALTAHLLRRYSVARERTTGALGKRQLQEVIGYIHDNAAHDLPLSNLAQIAGLSASHFRKLFKKSTGVSVHQYVIRARVERAVHLLSLGKVSVSDVASQTGFANQSHMARWVQHYTGAVPSAILRDSA
ncbi:MAG TPA: AraC family transcriptional regulator [Candidatus Baltobacteraceae bacterium]|jgi:AraC family transcriptional regulator